MDVSLKIASELAIIVVAKFLLQDEGDVQRWKASWIAGIATYVITCHSIKICVGMKRDQVALTSNAEVWAFILKHMLQFLTPVSHSSLAYAYLMGLDAKNQDMENDWKMVAIGIKMFTLVLGSLLVLTGVCKVCYSTANGQNQITAIQTNVENQSVANANVFGLGQRETENQSFAREEIQLDVDDYSYPDAHLSDWIVWDVENQLLADANVSEELQRDAENQSFAQEELQLDVEDHSYPDTIGCGVTEDAENLIHGDANVSVEVQSDAENQSVANENVSEEEVQRDVEIRSYVLEVTQWHVCHPSTSEFIPQVVMDPVKLWDKNEFSDTNDLKKLHWDVDKQFLAAAIVPEELQRCEESIICSCKCIGTVGMMAENH